MRRVALATTLLAISCSRIASAAPPGAEPTPPPRPVSIDKNSVLILIRTTLVAVQQANQTGIYSVLYSLSAPGFQKMNSPERLSQIFANLRAKHFDLSGVVVLEPQLMVMPEIYSNGVMRMAGFFPSVPMQVVFDLQFMPVDGQWRLIGVSIDLAGSTPAAPRQATPNPALASSHSPTPAATATPSVAPSQPPVAKPESAESPSVEINAKSKPKPSPTPRRKL